jgi:RNA polymerase sigma-70 factor (ECF subfamily)
MEKLIAAVWPEAFRLSLGILHDRGLAEDAAQEACAAMAVSLSSLKNAGAFRTWFYRVVVHESISASRRRRETVALRNDESAASETDSAQAIDLAKALQKLPPQQRAVVLLHYYAGLNSSEIASAADLPPSTVRFHLMLARRALRRALRVTVPPPTKEIASNAH